MSFTSDVGGAPIRARAVAKTKEPPPPLAVVVGLVVVIVALIAGATFGLVRPRGRSVTSYTPAQLLEKSLAAARKAQAMHIAVTQNVGDSRAYTSVDTSPDGGTETLTIDGGTAKVIAVDGQLYFEADAAFWSSQYNAPESFTQKFDGKWVKIPTDQSEFKLAPEVLTMPTIVDKLLAMSGSISKNLAPPKGQVALTGLVPYNAFTRASGGDLATLVVSSKSPFLPISFAYSGLYDGKAVRMTFSNWGERVPLAAPPSPLTLPVGATFAARTSGAMPAASGLHPATN